MRRFKKTAAVLGHKSHSTVYGWVRSGKVPAWRHAELRNALKRNNIHIPESIYQNAFARTNKLHEAELA